MTSSLREQCTNRAFDVNALARPAILQLRAYQSARSLIQSGSLGPSGASSDALTSPRIYLDANESPSSTAAEPLNRYPDPQPALIKQRLSEIYQVEPDQIMMGRGADEAIDVLVRVFCEPRKDQVLICPPTYGMYEVSAQIQGAGICRVPLRWEKGDFQLDAQAIAQVLSVQNRVGLDQDDLNQGEQSDQPIKLVFICSPNNPTGTVFDRQIITDLCEVALGRAIVVVDEAYAEFNTKADGSATSMLPEVPRLPNLVVLRTLSKAWAMAGVRCGVAIAQEPIVQLLQKVRAPYPFSYPSIRAILAGTNQNQEDLLTKRVEEIRRERERLVSDLLSLGKDFVESVYPSGTNFILVKFRNSKRVMELTRAQGIVLRDRSSEAGLDSCIRITIGSQSENQALVAVLKEGR